MRITDIVPSMLAEELLRLAKIDKNWVEWDRNPENPDAYRARCTYSTWVRKVCPAGADLFAMLALSRWLVDGPKMFKPTVDQCRAMENVDVNVMMQDYSQPYPAILIELDYPPFKSVLCFHDKGMLTCCVHSGDHKDDIVTTIASGEHYVEESLRTFDPACKEYTQVASVALRVACNCCLALSHYGCHLDYLLPKEAASDKRLAQEQTERGQRARQRLKLAVRVASFDQEVRLHGSDHTPRDAATGEPAYSVTTHWRRGHWRMQPHGEHKSLRKRIFIKPVLVRADLFVGETSDTMTTYQ